MKNVLFFDSMFTPKVISVLYWILSFATIVVGLFNLVDAEGVQFWMTLFGIPLTLIGIRVWCELVIILFKIHGNLQKIADKQVAQ